MVSVINASALTRLNIRARVCVFVGLMPDFVMCRSSSPLHKSVVAKLALFTQVSEAHIIGVHDVSNLYAVPLLLEDQNLSSVIVLICVGLMFLMMSISV